MIARRDVLKWGAALPAAPALPGVARAAQPGLDALLLDTRFALDGAELPAAMQTLRFNGDVTAIWFDTLDRAWRGRGYTVAGVTGSDALFVLETLARQHGRAVVERRELGPKDARGVALVAWVIAPVHPSVLV